MTELRWILLGLGVLFCLGLWWSETRRQRQATDPERNVGARKFFAQWTSARELQSDPEDSAAQVRQSDPDLDPDLEDQQPSLSATQRIEPKFGDEWRDAPGGESDTLAPVEPAPEPPPPVKEEKIVTLRVVANPSERFQGAGLVDSLRSAGLEHGKFSIFHRQGADGRTLFSVASMVKPGSFDLQTMGGQQFPGIVLFAVLRPGEDDPATDVVDMMLSTAKQLARLLNGSLQDDRGAPLTLARLAALRAEIADWRRLPA